MSRFEDMHADEERRHFVTMGSEERKGHELNACHLERWGQLVYRILR